MISVIYLIIGFVIILGIAAVGGSITERVGIINLSIEGFMTIGAISYSMLAGMNSFRTGTTLNQFWMMPLSAIIAGLFAVIYSSITVKLKANQTIAGIALNAFALALAIFIIHSRLNPQATTSSLEDKITIQDGVWGLTLDTTQAKSLINIIVLLGLPVIAIVIFILNKTKYGIKLKSCGEQPQAAASLGINVERVQFYTIMFSGMVSGLAGAMFAQFNKGQFFGSTQGFGFLAVAMVIFGQWRPSMILIGSIIFGFLYGTIAGIPFIDWLNTFKYPVLLETIPYLVSVIVLIFTQRKSKAPKALGIPYMNAGR